MSNRYFRSSSSRGRLTIHSSETFLTTICAGLALAVLGWLSLYGLRARWQWLRAQEELGAVRKSLDPLFGSQSHRQLYGSSEEVLSAFLDQTSSAPQARVTLDELIPAVREYHRRAMAGGSEAWEEIRDSYLEQARQPLRMVRGAAGWVVLLGLAGTVLGFGSAMPSLRNVLTSHDEANVASATPEPSSQPTAADPATAAGKRLAKVLDSLEGVFSATFAGVLSSLLLSILALTLLEPAYNRFSREVDLLGARWFVPLIHAPDTLVDDALRSELKTYFDRISERMEAVLHPLVHSLSVSLTQMSGLATDFSGNIRMGVSTLETFRDAVARLGGSAEGAVEQLVKMVSLSTSFVQELETLQEKGARTLAVPAEKLAGSAMAIETQIGALGKSSQASLDYLSKLLHHGLTALREAQQQAQEGSRESLVDLATTTKSLRDLLTQAASAGDKDQGIRDLRREIERLHLQITELSNHLQPTQRSSEPRDGRLEGEAQAELFRILRDIRALLGEAPRNRSREGPPPRQLIAVPAEPPRPAPTRWQSLKRRMSKFFTGPWRSQRANR